ncbi:Clavaminate synthase-like protein [Calocera viscosa TUFC12733]|uniref:Clavaminate synthase-like protein n=1 Tax=Calocera viscosa (strain TUFC12733) TaxID=1330018 RepID=A0A167IAC4_CALVF|nr:Clavaminate synthase-like protein [Calocera viscosa TUFC12733]
MGNCLTLLRCAEKCLDTLAALADEGQKNDLTECGDDVAARFNAGVRDSNYQNRGRQMAKLVALAYERMTEVHHSQVRYCWRRLYTDASLALICSAVYNTALEREAEGEEEPVSAPDTVWRNWVRGLDMIIIIAGAPGKGRLEMVHELIYGIQSGYDVGLSAPPVAINPVRGDILPPPKHSLSVRRLSKAPTMAAFERLSSEPFILPGWARDWPAMKEKHDWSSPSYLLSVAGPGRVVPVEVGSDYRRDDWSQELMEWEEFLQRIGMIKGEKEVHDHRPVYLAQYNLFKQFHKLRNDFEVPDYVYSGVGEGNPDYIPPANEEGLMLNAWLGPKGMVSPAHSDPYYNIYTQVVGRKTVWLAPSSLRRGAMYQYMCPLVPQTIAGKPPASTTLEKTSSIDVFSSLPLVDKPWFIDEVLPRAMCCVLEPGDMLYIPILWWHAMRSEDISFSVSMWF